MTTDNRLEPSFIQHICHFWHSETFLEIIKMKLQLKTTSLFHGKNIKVPCSILFGLVNNKRIDVRSIVYEDKW